MTATGNAVAARYWEARMPASSRPRQSDNAALQVGIYFQSHTMLNIVHKQDTESACPVRREQCLA